MIGNQRNLKYQSGQALLITILVLSIATTIALSLIGRGTVDVNISNQIEESSRAFNAAEAGIEESLQSGVGTSTKVLTPGVNYSVNIASIAAAAGTYTIFRKTPIGITDTIWLVNHNANGTLNETPVYTASTINVCWSIEASVQPALVVSLLAKDSTGVYKLYRKPIDPAPLTRSNTNQFDSSGITSPNGCGLTNYYQKTIDFTSLGSGATDTRLALRIRPEYADTYVAVNTGAVILPKQGNRIDSTGVTDSGVSRKIVVYKLYRACSSLCDYVVYEQNGDFGH